MFKLELEPWIKADMESGGQMAPILTWRDEYETTIHLVKDDNEYCLAIGYAADPNAKMHFKLIAHWPKEILRDIVERFPLDE